ncbi:hypothetical protein X769_02395 [Mesorhizobium sp. LSJC268A00]|uniref:hypothetical protein n=1 Tax=unclassified Mesorhizobium TaxID=325217 RepID=UPI0003CF91FE|nr:hypothetical protein X769_02395 [Mesorhizobium sp. LSJC268A00]ESX50448.1 hypothetical protein X762_09810 [Mesorhizobium sp. LSHC426A00]ESX57884.1 hypothetical protein X761_08715 [Mesorhizobium sp. LSHC424B00]ESX75378.1 hypothetical protein X758_03240 [Mesorhizobium sp. LSHC416B00]ESZ17675.1 hypothetical protein X735_08505 [Mesorhizobium sp. L2C085B000]
MVRRAPGLLLQNAVTDICGYRETAPGHFRNVEYASLTVPLVISFAEPLAIGLGRKPASRSAKRPNFVINGRSGSADPRMTKRWAALPR